MANPKVPMPDPIGDPIAHVGVTKPMNNFLGTDPSPLDNVTTDIDTDNSNSSNSSNNNNNSNNTSGNTKDIMNSSIDPTTGAETLTDDVTQTGDDNPLSRDVDTFTDLDTDSDGEKDIDPTAFATTSDARLNSNSTIDVDSDTLADASLAVKSSADGYVINTFDSDTNVDPDKVDEDRIDIDTDSIADGQQMDIRDDDLTEGLTPMHRQNIDESRIDEVLVEDALQDDDYPTITDIADDDAVAHSYEDDL